MGVHIKRQSFMLSKCSMDVLNPVGQQDASGVEGDIRFIFTLY